MAFDMAQVDTRMANNLTPRQMLDLRNQPGGTCVEYVEPQVAGRTPPVVDRSNQCPQKPFFNVLHKWLKAKGIAAGIYTQTTDVEGEINGLLTYDRKVQKLPAATLKAILDESGLLGPGKK